MYLASKCRLEFSRIYESGKAISLLFRVDFQILLSEIAMSGLDVLSTVASTLLVSADILKFNPCFPGLTKTHTCKLDDNCSILGFDNTMFIGVTSDIPMDILVSTENVCRIS